MGRLDNGSLFLRQFIPENKTTMHLFTAPVDKELILSRDHINKIGKRRPWMRSNNELSVWGTLRGEPFPILINK